MATHEEEPEGARGGRPRSTQAQQAILDATLSLLATEGFDAMSIEAIAARAGVGKKTIYRWWSSKDALVIDAIKTIQQTKNPVINTGSLREDLITLFSNTFRVWNGPHERGLLANLLGVVVTHPEIYQALYEQVLAPRVQQFQAMVQRAQERGEIRPELATEDIAAFFAGPIWFHLLFDGRGIVPAPDLPERLVDMVLRGVAAVREDQQNIQEGRSFL